MIIVSRLRYQQRRRLLARVEEAVGAHGSTSQPARATAADPFAGVSSDAIQRLAFETRVTRAVNEVVSQFIVATVGPARLLRTAAGDGRRVSRWKRIGAMRVLALAAPRAVLPTLEAALRDPDTEVVAAAVAALGNMSEPAAGELLVHALERGYYSASRLATFLERFALLMPESLRPLLRGSTATVRYWGAVLARRYKGLPWVEEELSRLASDEAPAVRKAALQSLAALGTPAAVPAATRSLADPVWFVRAHAARALGEIGAHDQAGAVAALLADREWWVRQAAKESLLRMGRGAEDAVVAALSHADRFARNSAAEILQDNGALERLLTEVALGGAAPGVVVTVQRACEAGGPRLVRAVVDRLPADLRPRAMAAASPAGATEAV